MTTEKTATLLLKFAGLSGDAASFDTALAGLFACAGIAVRTRQVNHALAGGEAYVYIELEEALALDAADMCALEVRARELPALASLSLSASRLLARFDRPGASAGEQAPFHLFHYCVECDPAPGWEDEIVSWYETEHMPGLAAVEGCVRARRFLNIDAGPRSLACYDLVSPAVRESNGWQAVVATDWSSRVRPNFCNTKRTTFHRTEPR